MRIACGAAPRRTRGRRQCAAAGSLFLGREFRAEEEELEAAPEHFELYDSDSEAESEISDPGAEYSAAGATEQESSIGV